MDKSEDKDTFRNETINCLINFIRDTYPDEIETAYEFFWEEEEPEEMLGGTALSLAFINFEDWLICDYRRKEGCSSFVDQYIEDSKPDPRAISLLTSLRDSSLSLYEVKSVDGAAVTLNDLLHGGETVVQGSSLPGLKPGTLFGSRIFEWEGSNIMGRGVYPFNQGSIERVRAFIDKELKRYSKPNGKNPGGNMRQFLKEEGYFMNNAWLNCIFTRNKS